MTRRGLGMASALAAAWLCALSVGGTLYYFIAALLSAVMAYALVSCLLARLSLGCRQWLGARAVVRGETAELNLTLWQRCPLPVAPVTVRYLSGGQMNEYAAPLPPFHNDQRRLTLAARHVGCTEAGIKQLIVTDLFGLFEMKKKAPPLREALLVLPKPFHIDKPTLNLGDEGGAALSRTQEDYNAPEDTRAYRPGDAMKRIHWKLSSRRRELVVRRFETPAPPDTLILLDCAAPCGGEGLPEGKERLRDALCETAVAVARLQTDDGSPVRLPIYGKGANEFSSDNAAAFSLLQEMLASQAFDEDEDFSRVLNLELRRMRRTGATIVITTRLNAPIVEAVGHIRRMGPSVRLYLVTFRPDDPSYQPFVASLQHHLVEVCYVTPA